MEGVGAESKFDAWIRINVNEPLVRLLPRSVSPNSLTLTNTVVCWVLLLSAFFVKDYTQVYPLLCLLIRIGLGFLTFTSMVLDCLDGMQARKTQQCSKLGELLDHAFDAGNITLTAAAVYLSLVGIPRFTMAVGLIGSGMIYNAQLVCYRHTKKMIMPPLSGPQAQVMGSLSHVAIGFLYYFFNDTMVLTVSLLFFSVITVAGSLQNIWFYQKLLSSIGRPLLVSHWLYNTLTISYGIMFCCGLIGTEAFVFGSCLFSFRLSGRYLLATMLGFLNKKLFPREEPWSYYILLSITVQAIAGLENHGLVFMPWWFYDIVPIYNWVFYVSLFLLNVRAITKYAGDL